MSVSEVITEVNYLLEKNQPEAVTNLLNTVTLTPDSLAPYRYSSPAHYTRNLIFKNRLFEMLLLCWDVGHRSWIHNHHGQHCWMAVIEGTLVIRNYARLGCDQQQRTVRLEPVSEFIVYHGSSAAVDPKEPVHLVWNPERFNQPAMSVHIYSLPFETCVVYDDEVGLCREATLFYTSEYGELTNRHKGGGKLTDLPACACRLSSAEQDAHCGAVPVNV
jgi:cysteine dioxygenase